MSFFDDASLAFLPSGAAGKDGKAYSIKPTNGDGDFTFSRGSNLSATRVGADKLIEKGRENLLLQSNNFGTTWGDDGGIIASGFEGYDGTNNAWKYTKTGQFDGTWQSGLSITGVHTISIYAKLPDGETDVNSLLFRIDYSGGNTNVVFSLTGDGVPSVGGNGIVADKINIGNGWFRCVLTLNQPTTKVNFRPSLGSSTSGTNGSIYIQDAQLEIGLAATDYIESGATTGKAGLLEDEPRFDYSGGTTCPSLLLEPSRTNLIWYSEYYRTYFTQQAISVATNAIVSPEGLQNASKLIPNSGTGGNRSLGKGFTGLSGIHTFSTFAKAGEYGYVSLRMRNTPSAFVMFDLNNGLIHNINSNAQYVTGSAKIEDYGNGWYRCSASFDPSGSGAIGDLFPSLSAGITGDEIFDWSGDGVSGIYIYGLQFEAGSYPTSYIPNHSGGTITRGVDRPYLTQDFSSIAPKSAGTMYLEYDANVVDSGAYWVGLSTSSSSLTDWVFVGRDGASNRLYIRANGVLIDSTSITHSTSGTQKLAIVWNESTGTSAFINGTKVDSTTGSFSFAGNFGHLNLGGSTASNPVSVVAPTRQFLLFPEALSDADCITLTTI